MTGTEPIHQHRHALILLIIMEDFEFQKLFLKQHFLLSKQMIALGTERINQ